MQQTTITSFTFFCEVSLDFPFSLFCGCGEVSPSDARRSLKPLETMSLGSNRACVMVNRMALNTFSWRKFSKHFPSMYAST